MRGTIHRLSVMAWLGVAAFVAFPSVAQQALTGGDRDYDALLAAIGEARVVLLGEATHGSREFYEERARITRRPAIPARV